ncbi:Acyl-protein thioesterase 1 [Cladobotryum mycophilum]|uniref:Acyl-protein thioesterase 1 n=1 Tax=Cladobotryum mycophilum TaxID=491253 RepID=A0ABR0SAH9_9HYPO
MPAYRAPLVIPAISRHTATVIFAHGLGDTGNGWSDIVQVFRKNGRLNEVKFILPHAPTIPITMNHGFAMPGWFDVISLGGNTDPFNSSNDDEEGILQSRKYLNSLIENEIERNGIPSERIVIGGFSQGGAMSIFSGLTSPVKLGGIVGLSCWLLLNQKFKSFVPEGEINKATPVFMGHGDMDPLVRYEWAQATQSTLKDLGYDVNLRTYRGVEHSADMQELDDVEAFLASRLPAKDK